MTFTSFGPKVLSVAAAALLLAACETAPETGAASSAAGAAPAQQQAAAPQTTGIRPGSQQDFVVNVGDRVFFAYDKAELTPQARQQLDRWVAWMRSNGAARIVVEGHCDERGTREYNLALGERRANAVRNYLTNAGVAAARLTTISYGKERPVALGSNEAAWAQNRRAVGVVQQ